ncbi:Hsp33 family molecular chaperone HslO [Rivihabitans pingtungensis]|jgi:molecular chaperone Hsp33|uniref:33 kDa chaperonin n=1 Tax=Rivihabitans pingtungensis TaxID=1054498 RepID=A0A318KX88_9NEIS|nr:Hsp33 family molecular chaperone HslO [Rivihabitans pingtungensis]PXX81182.1 molecular chaperone Hsp33 [Rivihabitans pingtungensis]
MHDVLQRFLFNEAPVRGALIRLDQAWQEILSHHAYPPRLRDLLGELLAAGALLAANLKFDGTLVMQMQGSAALKLAVVEINADHTLRATARWDGELDDDASVAALLGQGQFVITLDPRNGSQPYQGIVALEGDNVAAMLEHYMLRSEQLDTRLLLACNGDSAAGMLLQRLPEGHGDSDGWPRVQALAETVSAEELLTLPADTLLYRLFHQESVQCFEPASLNFACTCSRERVAGMLQMMGAEEVASVIQEQGSVEVQCDFCNQRYVFDEGDAEGLFTDAPPNGPAPSLH